MAVKDILSGLFKKSDQHSLPESFLFGVATADHQCEAFDERYIDIRDLWEETYFPKAARGRATDFWNRYVEDIEKARDLGCNAFRFSISWSRIEPSAGQYSEEAFEHYEDLIRKIISCHMVPVLTLHHFTWPVHVQERGGMIADEFPEIYAGYVRKVAERFAGIVPYWITFNEPNLLMGGYLKPWWDENYAAPPGMPEGTSTSEEVEAVGKLIRNLFLSHKMAYEIIKAENPQALVGANQYFFGLPLWLQRMVDRNASAIKGEGDLKKQVDRLALRRDLVRGERISGLRANTLEKESVDIVLAAVTRTEERETRVAFSEGYFAVRQKLLARSEDRLGAEEQLTGEKVAVRGTVSEEGLPLLFPESRRTTADSYEDALRHVEQSEGAVLLADETVLYGLMLQHPGRYRIVESAEALESWEGNGIYAAAIAKGDRNLLEVVNTVIRDFDQSSGMARWRSGYEKATGNQIQKPESSSRALFPGQRRAELGVEDGPTPKAPTGTVLRRIQERGYIVVGVREDLPGFSYCNPDTGKLEGLEIILAQALAEGIFGDKEKLRLVPVAVQDRIKTLEDMPVPIDWTVRQYTILSTVLLTNWWYMGMAGELSEYLCPPGCEGKMDFVGLDYYWGISSIRIDRLQRLLDAAYRRFDRAPVWPEALYNILEDLHRKFPDHPMIICENGSVKVADGWDRARYIAEHIKQVNRAVKDGFNVDGYICWSITSNREWDLKFDDASDFGLYHIDLDRETDPPLVRQRTAAADKYEEIIKKEDA